MGGGLASAIGGPEVRRREKKRGRKEVALVGPGGFLGKNGKSQNVGGVRDGPFTDPWDAVLGLFGDFQGFQGCTSNLPLRETQSDWWRL